jgi:Kef-type K+ transport system membrane component KefB
MASTSKNPAGRTRPAHLPADRKVRVNSYLIAAVWLGLALVASLISIRIGISVALIEILVGAVFANTPGVKEHLTQTEITTFLANVGSLLLTFLAGAEIDPVSLRRHWKASVSIGAISFVLPFVGSFYVCRLALHWNLHASEIGAIALSTTSVAVIYAVLVETGLNRHDVGKLLLGACFVSGLLTLSALGALFTSYGWLLVVFLAVTVASAFLLPRLLRLVIDRLGHRVSEPEVKFLFAALLGLGGLATAAGIPAVLSAYIAGLVVAGVFVHDRVILGRIRTIAFALLTPFFFIRTGALISAPVLISGAGVIGLLFVVKMATKLAGVWPLTVAFGIPARDRAYTTLLMATGLTFGTIAALYGLTHHLVGQRQYTELITVIVLSAFVPTLIAQRFFQPTVRMDAEDEEALGGEDASIVHRAPTGERPAPD